MELRHLRYFLAVADAQNFSRAAETVHVSQPSLSVQIRALEEELGARLFDRLGRKVVLTRVGEIFREHAERVMRELEQASLSVQELQGARRGRLVVGALSTVNSYLIPPLVARFKRRFPGIHLQVHAQPSPDIVAALLANRLDMGICLLPVAGERLTATHLFDERLALVAPAGFPLRKPRLRMRELAGLPLVLMPADYCLRKMIEAECGKAGIEPQVGLEMTSPEGILEAVAEGTGLTILPELYVRLHLRRRRLRTLDLIEPTPRHSVGLVHLTDRYQSLAAREFARLCQATVMNCCPHQVTWRLDGPARALASEKRIALKRPVRQNSRSRWEERRESPLFLKVVGPFVRMFLVFAERPSVQISPTFTA